MSGYRQSSFDPNAGGDYGPPLRPYSWVQWTGVAFIFIGVGFFAVWAAGKLGWIPKLLDDPMPVSIFTLFGVVLINSRRAPVSSEYREKVRRRTYLALGVALAAALIGAAVAFFLNSQGA